MTLSSPEDKQITILHLSDFHFSEENREDINIVLDALFADWDNLKDKYNLTPDIIVISGDLAKTGDQAEYKFALTWLKDLLKKINLPPDRVFIVPGNHDVNRTELKKWGKIEFKNEEEVTKFLNSTSDEKRTVFKKLDNFFKFTKKF